MVGLAGVRAPIRGAFVAGSRARGGVAPGSWVVAVVASRPGLWLWSSSSSLHMMEYAAASDGQRG